MVFVENGPFLTKSRTWPWPFPQWCLLSSSGTTNGKRKVVPFNDKLLADTFQIYYISGAYRARYAILKSFLLFLDTLNRNISFLAAFVIVSLPKIVKSYCMTLVFAFFPGFLLSEFTVIYRASKMILRFF